MVKCLQKFIKYLRAKSRGCIEQNTYDGDKAQYIHLAFTHLVIYLVFLIMATICMYRSFAMSTRKIEMFHFTRFIDQLFVQRHAFNNHNFMLTFAEAVTVGDWWTFMQSVFIPNIQHFIPQDGTQGFTYGGHILIGLPRLRQIRVRNETCTIHNAVRNLFRVCFGPYTMDNEDKSVFFNTSYMDQSHSIWGHMATYYGGGYTQTLSLELGKNQELLGRLKESNWVDRGTRLIALEFALYNANVNLICNIKLLAEIAPSGGILTFSHIHPMKGSYWCRGFIECVCKFMFYTLLLYYTFEVLLKISVIGFFKFLTSVWSLLDFTIILLGTISLVYIPWHEAYLDNFLNSRLIEMDRYKMLDGLSQWNTRFNVVMGTCLFFIWIKIFKYVRLNKTMLQFSITLRRSANDLIGFAIMFTIVFIAYANLSVLLFGTIHINFANFPSAVVTMIRMVLGDFNYLEVQEANKILAPLYFLSYVLFVFFILVNMFLAIVNDTYSDIKSKVEHGKGINYIEYAKYLLKKLKNKILKKEDNKSDERELEEILVPTEQRVKGANQTLNEAHNKILSEWFEIVSVPRTTAEEEVLSNRMEKLEQTVEKISQGLEKLLREINQNSKKRA